MAKGSKKAAGAGKKKAKSVKLGEGVKLKVKVKDKASSGKSAKSGKAGDHGAFESLARLAEHPIVADLIAVGATAAVAALAERGLGDKGNSAAKSGNAAKAAGKAAAAAIGRRLVSEFNAVKDAAKDAGKKA